MASRVLRGNVFDQLPTITPGSMDVCVTSPPYWALRSYLPKSSPLKKHELGNEKSPAEYVANMVRVMALVRDCLADHGTLWLNVGDTYSGSWGNYSGGKRGNGGQRPVENGSLCHQPSYDGLEAECPPSARAGIDNGNLCLIPWRLAAALQDDGWIVRSIVAWTKPAPMPCSVSGWAWRRCRVKVADGERSLEKKASTTNGNPHAARAANGKDFARAVHHQDGKANTGLIDHSGYERVNGVQWTYCPGCKKCRSTGGYVIRRGSWRPTSAWEPILMLAKTEDYFSDGEPVKTLAAPATLSRNKYTRILDDADEQFAVRHDHETTPTTANLRDVWRLPLEDLTKGELIQLVHDLAGGGLPDTWRISAEPLKEKHYAAFPTELVRRCLLAGTSAHGYCTACGKPFVRVIESKAVPHPSPRSKGRDDIDTKGGNQANGSASLGPETTTIGWRASCKCPNPTARPGLVLDPFVGSGRTGIAAQRLGLDFVGCELNPYADMAERLIRGESPLFA